MPAVEMVPLIKYTIVGSQFIYYVYNFSSSEPSSEGELLKRLPLLKGFNRPVDFPEFPKRPLPEDC
jgi:hypothetical protein